MINWGWRMDIVIGEGNKESIEDIFTIPGSVPKKIADTDK